MRVDRRRGIPLRGVLALGLALWSGWGSFAPVRAQPAETVQASPVVAVLPFRVHSARPIEYLGESLADLLRTRLEAGGRLTVLDPAATTQIPDAQGAATQDAALRELRDQMIGAGTIAVPDDSVEESIPGGTVTADSPA